MPLPLKPPLQPQLALSRKELPREEGWAYEPKWDGFRAIAFVDGDEVQLQSRTGKPMRRYFPELDFPSGRYVLDGELVILDEDGREHFDALQSRLHPADSRIRLLSERIPARIRVFDLLAEDDESLLRLPFRERRARLENLIARLGDRKKETESAGGAELTPIALAPDDAERWLAEGEGTIAKRLDAPYRPGERKGMVKVKRLRTADCIVMGWRPGKEEGTVGALILGLYDGEEPRVVGHTSGFRASEKLALRKRLAPYETGERGAGEPSRWSGGRDLEWVALRPELVVEVSFDHVSAGRIRHGTKLLRWREDKDPRECTFDQLSA